MSRRHLEPALSVSLFPFLAVLVSAMGALILLLLIITRNVRPEIATAINVASIESLQPHVRASVASLPENTAPSKLIQINILSTPVPESLFDFEPVSKLEDQKILLELQQEKLEQTLREYQTIQANVASLSKQVVAQKNSQQQLQLKTASVTRQLVDSEQTSRQHQQAARSQKEELQRLQIQLQQKKEKVIKQKKIASDLLGKLQIVTYDGANGIHRKPIFLECIAGKVVFQPDGIELSKKELEQYSPVTHPLGYAVRKLAQFRSQQANVLQQPYVLLVVRPDGIEEFYASRRILAAQEISFGYELVEGRQKQKLYFKQPDSAAKQVISTALLEAKKQSKPIRSPGAGGSQLGRVANRIQPSLPGSDSGKNNPSGFGQPAKKHSANKNNSRNQAILNGLQKPTLGMQPQPAKQSTKNPPSGFSPAGSQRSLQMRSLSERANHLRQGAADPLISFERLVSVRLSSNQIIVGKQKPITILAADTEILTQQKFLNSLSNEMARWGPAPDGFRWVPGFQFHVSPGGNQIAFRLEAVAKELKLSSKTDFKMETR